MNFQDLSKPIVKAAFRTKLLQIRARKEAARVKREPTPDDVRYILAITRNYNVSNIRVDDPDFADEVLTIREDCERVLRYFGEPLRAPEGV